MDEDDDKQGKPLTPSQLAVSKEAFLAENPHLRDFVTYLDSLNKESERGAVLISCALIDDLLSRTVKAFLVPGTEHDSLLEGPNAPLGTFWARSVACYTLGLISEQEYRECGTLRKIRVRFAHDVQISFRDARVMDLCANLTMAAKPYGDIIVDARGSFTTASVSLILHLTNRSHYVSKKQLKRERWPY